MGLKLHSREEIIEIMKEQYPKVDASFIEKVVDSALGFNNTYCQRIADIDDSLYPEILRGVKMKIVDAKSPGSQYYQVIDSKGNQVPLVYSYNTETKEALVYLRSVNRPNHLITDEFGNPMVFQIKIPGSTLVDTRSQTKEVLGRRS